MKVKNEKGLGKALKDKENCIELEFDLFKRVFKLKAVGDKAWIVAISFIAIAAATIIIIVISGGAAAPVAIPVTTAGLIPASIALGGGSAGISLATSAVAIAVSGGGVSSLNRLRKYKLKKEGGRYFLTRK